MSMFVPGRPPVDRPVACLLALVRRAVVQLVISAYASVLAVAVAAVMTAVVAR